MRTFTYIIGAPGSGKSTLVQALTAGQVPYAMPDPVPHIVYGDGGTAQLGKTRGEFAGTDALAMNIQPIVEEWLTQRPYRHFIAEGDRLANAKFFRAIEAAGYKLLVIHLRTESAAARRAARSVAMNLPEQNATWVKGRISKVNKLASQFDAAVIPGDLPVNILLEEIRRRGLDPFHQMVPA